jgi:phage N-6-adenine-methyltransferase
MRGTSVTDISIPPYAAALNEQKQLPAHKLKEIGDQWRTPDALFWGINAMFGPLVLDLFSDGENSKCPVFYTVEDNALKQDWSERLKELNGAAFGNPPYSRASQHEGQQITGMSHIMNHTFKMRELGGRYVFLIKAATSETWWPEGADHVSFIRGRIGFDAPFWFKPADEKQIPTGAFFAGAVAVFDKKWRGPAFNYIDREVLLAQGEAFLFQIRREAKRLQQHIQPQNIPENIPKPDCEDQPAEKTHEIIEKVMGETEIPLTKELLLAESGIQVWACAAAAFGDKATFTFSESKYAHSWAADSVEQPEFVVVPAETIAKAVKLIRSSSEAEVIRAWVNSTFTNSDAQADMIQRLNTVASEFNEEIGLSTSEFITLMERLDQECCMNIRVLRSKIREVLAEIGVVHHDA